MNDLMDMMDRRMKAMAVGLESLIDRKLAARDAAVGSQYQAFPETDLEDDFEMTFDGSPQPFFKLPRVGASMSDREVALIKIRAAFLVNSRGDRDAREADNWFSLLSQMLLNPAYSEPIRALAAVPMNRLYILRLAHKEGWEIAALMASQMEDSEDQSGSLRRIYRDCRKIIPMPKPKSRGNRGQGKGQSKAKDTEGQASSSRGGGGGGGAAANSRNSA